VPFRAAIDDGQSVGAGSECDEGAPSFHRVSPRLEPVLGLKRMRLSNYRLQMAAAVALVVIAGSATAWALGERVVDVRVLGAVRTDESTVRSIAGIQIGDTLENETLALVRERLNTTGLFADVNVWWENFGEGVRVNIAVKDKFPWAPVPTGSWSANNRSVGLLFVHGNLFGWGKQMALGGRWAQLDSGALLAYRDPALFQTWMFWELKAIYQRQIIPEYVTGTGSMVLAPDSPWRQTTFDAFGIEPAFGVAWFRRVKTQVSWRLDKVNYKSDELFDYANGGVSLGKSADLGIAPTTKGGVMGIGRAAVAFDWRAREHAVMMGEALGGNLDIGGPEFGGDFKFWKASAFWEQGIRIFKRHNFIYSGGATAGHNLPLWWDPTSGGPSLRGYLTQQFRGDSQISAKAEYHFPLFSVGSLDFRALGFYDFAAIWFRELPASCDDTGTLCQRMDGDLRSFGYVQKGLDVKRDLHNSVGGGLRFFLRSVAVPLVGFDAGYGLESKHWRFTLIVGA
jgi:outer membrane protein assembly factor BamA